MTICKTTGDAITLEEMSYRDDIRNKLLARLQLQFNKSREQVLELFRFYSAKRIN
jgi:hypothetical protein